MSLLADLLSKVKESDQKAAVPPGLSRIVQNNSSRWNIDRKIKITLVAALFLLLSGFSIVYFVNVSVKPSPVSVNRPPPIAAASGPSPTATAGEERPAKNIAPPVANPAGQTSPATHSTGPSITDPTLPEETTTKGTRPTATETVSPAGAGTSTQKGSSDAMDALPQFHVHKKLALPGKSGNGVNENVRNERDDALYSARNFEEKKEYDEAIAYYKKALALDPKNYLMMNNIAGLFIATGAYRDSLKYAMEALRIDKNYAPSLVNAGIANIRLGNNTEGELYLTKARALEPANKIVLLNLALSYEKSGNYPEALSIFHTLAGMKDAQGILGAARVREKEGKFEDAGNLYRDIIDAGYTDASTKTFATERLRIIRNRYQH